MKTGINYSVFLSNFSEIKEILARKRNIHGSYIFTSLHIIEEMNKYLDEYPIIIKKMILELKNLGYKVVADVSARSLEKLNYSNYPQLARDLKIDILRIDYGMSVQYLLEVSKEIKIALNASILDLEKNEDIIKEFKNVICFHNYYPRPETALDKESFDRLNREIRKHSILIFGFISGDVFQRGPIYEGLPTLEEHRYSSPYVAFLDMKITYQIDYVFSGDGVVSKFEEDMIDLWIEKKIVSIPIVVSEKVPSRIIDNLLENDYTIRFDSPQKLKRLSESREFSTIGRNIEEFNSVPRNKGSITIDNYLYGRYSGEIQIICEDLPQDNRVNVLATIPKKHINILNLIDNKSKVRFLLY